MKKLININDLVKYPTCYSCRRFSTGKVISFHKDNGEYFYDIEHDWKINTATWIQRLLGIKKMRFYVEQGVPEKDMVKIG